MRGLREESGRQEGPGEETGQEGLLNPTAAALPLGAAAFISTSGTIFNRTMANIYSWSEVKGKVKCSQYLSDRGVSLNSHGRCAAFWRDGSNPDVTNNLACDAAVQKLYKAGIVGGDAGTGNYRPNDGIKRSEACVIFTRIAMADMRAK